MSWPWWDELGDSFRYASDLTLRRRIESVVTRDGHDALYEVADPFTVRLFDGFDLTVPAGFMTDLASVPRCFRWAVGRVGPYLEAAIVHDYLYASIRAEHERDRKREAWPGAMGPPSWTLWPTKAGGHGIVVERVHADWVMRVAMDAAEVPRWKARLIWLAVRLGGWRSI